MVDACRSIFSSWWKNHLLPGTNAGLLRDKYLRVAVKDKADHQEARRELFEAMCQSLVQSEGIYLAAYTRQLTYLPKPNAEGFFCTNGRMVIGLGGENVLETGLTLQHTYGTPIIPGTALKGLASHYCDQVWGTKDSGFKRWRKKEPGGDYHKAIFGTTEDSGHILFHDAWITPKTLVGSLKPDVMTPHHSEYYSGKAAPTDFDDPKPVTFLSVVGTFHVVISCDVPGDVGQEWANLALSILSDALKYWGIGGKTSADYGKLERSDNEMTTISSGIVTETTLFSTIETSPEEEENAENEGDFKLDRLEAHNRIQMNKYKKGDKVEAVKAADPNVRKERAYFKTDDGFGGFIRPVIAGRLSHLEIGQKAILMVAGFDGKMYDFIIPGLKEESMRQRRSYKG